MNGERPQVNGHHILNGATSTQHHQATEAKTSRSAATSNGLSTKTEPSEPYVNGVHPHEPATTKLIPNGLHEAPPEILQRVSREHYLPIASLINRRTQVLWHRLSGLLDHLATFDVPIQPTPPGAPIRNQTKPNLDKKERFLEFAQNEREDLVKLLVLLQWSKRTTEVANTISINAWLRDRRVAYWNVTAALASIKRDAVGFQIPNPDINTAGEVLSTSKVSSFPDIGYKKPRALSKKQILAVLKRLDRALSLRLSLLPELPPHLRTFSIYNGRATFIVPGEFELDLSVLDESLESPFRVVDFRFTFNPRPTVPDHLHAEIEQLANAEIDTHGLDGCYQFLHELTLSNKLIELHKQALDSARGQWAGQLRIELLRRNLVVQYWLERPMTKSWFDIGINRDGPGEISSLAIRWYREGRLVTDFELDLDLTTLSLESIISQIIAQHSSWILDQIYDRLAEVPLYGEDGLLIEQSSSNCDPEDCCLQIQITNTHEVLAVIDSITGTVKISPASDHANRLQSELNRSKNLLAEFVPKILSYRCVLAEAIVRDAITDTDWEWLNAFKPTSNDIRAVIAGPITRVNFFRHPTWSKEYLLAISHNSDGDEIWILQQAMIEDIVSFVGSHIVHRDTLSPGQECTAESLEVWADFASRLIVLQANADALRRLSWKCQIDDEDKHSLHLLSFDIGNVLTLGNQDNPSAPSTTVSIDNLKLDVKSKASKMSARVRTHADASVLARLSESNPDNRIVFVPKDRQIVFEMSAVVGKPVIEEIVSQVTRVQDLTACIQTIQGLATTKLTSISMNAMSINYEIGGIQDQSVEIQFPTTSEPAKVHFRPLDTNPHVRLASSLSRLLNEKGRPFAAKLTDAISCLSVTRPLIVALRDLEATLRPDNVGAASSQAGKIQVHIIVRQPTMFALQFYTRPKAQAPSTGPQSRLLARFEILPQSHGRSSWLIRPAMEEINNYSKASFASPSLQAKVKQEIFTKVCPEWIRLDTGAVCLVDRPQPLLKAIQQVMADWVEQNGAQSEPLPIIQATVQAPAPAPPQPPVKPPQPGPLATSMKLNANNRPVPNKGPNRPTNQMPNGINQQQQRARPVPAKPHQAPPKNSEIITLD